MRAPKWYIGTMQSVLITGANRGLGLCLVQKFAAQGWRVIATERSASVRPQGVPGNVIPGNVIPGNVIPGNVVPGNVSWVVLDVQDGASIAGAVRAVSALTPGLDVLINNAAVNPRPDYDALLGELDFSAMQLAYDVNALGPLRVIQSFLPLLERGQRKLIVNVSSEAGSLRHSWRDRSYGYCMSKAALNMQTTILDRALKPRGFNVLALHPGWMRTEMGGANADLDPMETAEGMYEVVQSASAATPRFLQHDGKEFPW
jgi:NAD(P)-dependent dehydrogenase (short-subunit alcohol dehydrogenase family)